jgi:hypothetical protein
MYKSCKGKQEDKINCRLTYIRFNVYVRILEKTPNNTHQSKEKRIII